jgi:acyl dehydratase
MPGYNRHILSQGRGLSALWGLLVADKQSGGDVRVPGPVIEQHLRSPSDRLIDDFVKFSGGDPVGYREIVPPHLFCQWSLPLMLRVASGLPYPPTKVINAGCALRVLGPLTRGVTLHCKAQLVELDENERRAKMTIRVTTSEAGGPAAVEADLRVLVPLARGPSHASRPSKPKALVPVAARELSHGRLSRNAGADFAKLTGDFNPIHWVGPYARRVGFGGVIFHGFGMFARVFEALVRGVLSAEVSRLTSLDVTFTKPLVLPATVGVYLIPPDQVVLGEAAGGSAYLVGRFGVSR